MWIFAAMGKALDARTLFFGRTLRATVVAHDVERGSKGARLILHYRIGQGRERVLQVGDAEFKALPVGATFPVKVASHDTRAQWPIALPLGRAKSDFWSPFAFLAIGALFLGGFSYELIIRPFQIKRLVREGRVVVGQVSRVASNKNSWNVVASWLDDANTPRTTAESIGTRPALNEGDSITILFHPRGRRISAIYELSPYEVASVETAPSTFADSTRTQRRVLAPDFGELPRNVSLRPGRPLGFVGCLSVFALFALWMFWSSNRDHQKVWTQGRAFPATVAFKIMNGDDANAGCDIKYRWTPGRVEMTHKRNLSASGCAQLKAGQEITLRAFINNRGYSNGNAVITSPPVDSPTSNRITDWWPFALGALFVIFILWKFVAAQVRRLVIVRGFARSLPLSKSRQNVRDRSWILEADDNGRTRRFRVQGESAPDEWNQVPPSWVTLFRLGALEVVHETSEWRADERSDANRL